MKLAAIDIGSNAARLLISEVTEDKNGIPAVRKIDLVRVPLRLGFDVFREGVISREKQLMMIETMKAFRHLMNAYGIKAFKACATSAMRDAANAADIIARVKKETGIQIEIISGDMEAGLVFENHIAENMDKDHTYLYIDVGGGSTEVSFFSDGIQAFRRSFNIGTIRLLRETVTENEWDEMKDSLKKATKGHKEVVAIGSGGNINKLFSLSKTKEGKPLSIFLLKEYHTLFKSYSVEERMNFFNLREDRADVIVPALLIYINVMRWAGAEEILVPKVGLSDGLIHHLYDELREASRQGRLTGT